MIGKLFLAASLIGLTTGARAEAVPDLEWSMDGNLKWNTAGQWNLGQIRFTTRMVGAKDAVRLRPVEVESVGGGHA